MRSGASSYDPDGTQYLAQFGYVSDVPGALRTKEEVNQAILNFQTVANIPRTGQMDTRTREAMRMPRCGLPDTPALKDPQNFELGPSAWPQRDLTYSIIGSRLTSDLNKDVIRREIHSAMQTWQEVSTLKFREVSSPTADITISFDRYDHGDGFHFDGQGRVLAHAFPPGEGRGGDVHFDDDEKWTSESKDGTNLLTVAAHEVGHSLGIAHSQVRGALMYPFYQGYNANEKLLTQDDINAIITLYGQKDSVVTSRPTRPPVTAPGGGMVPPTKATDLDACSNLNAVAVIRGEMFAFKGQRFWRMNPRGLMTAYPVKIKDFWLGFPTNVDSIDAVFERPDNGKIIFFKGNLYFEFDANQRASAFPSSGRPIADLGLPSSLTKVDSIFVWGYDKRIYLFSGQQFWRFEVAKSGSPLRVEQGYPKDSHSVWKGVSFPIDAVVTQRNDITYFFKDDDYWEFDDKKAATAAGYPRRSSELWQHCVANVEDPSNSGLDGQSNSAAGQLIRGRFNNFHILISIAIFIHQFSRTLI